MRWASENSESLRSARGPDRRGGASPCHRRTGIRCAQPHGGMTEAARADVDASSALDRLSGEFASSIARVDSDGIDAAVADVLEQIGRALGADQVTVSGKPIDGDAR